jgi:hypothetical protein
VSHLSVQAKLDNFFRPVSLRLRTSTSSASSYCPFVAFKIKPLLSCFYSIIKFSICLCSDFGGEGVQCYFLRR